MPLVRYPLEDVQSPRFEPDARPGHEVLDGLGDEHLSGSGKGHDACADVHRDAGELLILDLAFPRRAAGPPLHPRCSNLIANGDRALDRASRTVEARKEATPCRVDLSTAISCELPPHESV